MNAEKRDRVWAPDPIEGYVLGYVTDVGGDSLTIETADNPAKVNNGWSCCCSLVLQKNRWTIRKQQCKKHL